MSCNIAYGFLRLWYKIRGQKDITFRQIYFSHNTGQELWCKSKLSLSMEFEKYEVMSNFLKVNFGKTGKDAI